MAINIKSTEVVALIRRLARERNVDLTHAVSLAVQHELERSRESREARLRRIRAIGDRVAALTVQDPRTVDEILGYDDVGLPE